MGHVYYNKAVSLFYRLAFIILLLSSLTACSMFQGLVDKIIPGANKDSNIPVGEFVGTWIYQDPKLQEAEELSKAAATVNPVTPNEPVQADPKSPENKKDENKKNAEPNKKEETKPEATSQAAPKPDKAHMVKIVLLPMDTVDEVGAGVLTFKNISQKFYWQAKGNNKDTWQIQFAKDNNVYSKLTYAFDFTGLLRKASVGYELSGTLHINNEGKDEDYSLETYRYMYPELVALPEDKQQIALGTELALNGKYFSANASENLLKFTEVKSQKQFEAPATAVRTEDSENNVLTLMTDKKWAKGEYQVFLQRGTEYKSNTITIKLK